MHWHMNSPRRSIQFRGFSSRNHRRTIIQIDQTPYLSSYSTLRSKCANVQIFTFYLHQLHLASLFAFIHLFVICFEFLFLTIFFFFTQLPCHPKQIYYNLRRVEFNQSLFKADFTIQPSWEWDRVEQTTREKTEKLTEKLCGFFFYFVLSVRAHNNFFFISVFLNHPREDKKRNLLCICTRQDDLFLYYLRFCCAFILRIQRWQCYKCHQPHRQSMLPRKFRALSVILMYGV